MKYIIIIVHIIVFVMCFMCFRLGVLVSESLYNQCADNVTPILTGEYGQPDLWETLTGPYLDVQTIQIQELQKENSRLKESVKSLSSRLRLETLCGDVECGTKVWFIDGHGISNGRISYYHNEEIKEGEIGGYEVLTEEQYNDEEYIGFNRILPKSDIYKSKNELLKTIKGM